MERERDGEKKKTFCRCGFDSNKGAVTCCYGQQDVDPALPCDGVMGS